MTAWASARPTPARIFDPFFTTGRDRGSTGLGLTIARAVLAAHGGELVVRVREARVLCRDRGAVFRSLYSLTAPAINPETRWRCSAKNTAITGNDTRIDPSANGPHAVLNEPTMFLSTTGCRITLLSAEKSRSENIFVPRAHEGVESGDREAGANQRQHDVAEQLPVTGAVEACRFFASSMGTLSKKPLSIQIENGTLTVA